MTWVSKFTKHWIISSPFNFLGHLHLRKKLISISPPFIRHRRLTRLHRILRRRRRALRTRPSIRRSAIPTSRPIQLVLRAWKRHTSTTRRPSSTTHPNVRTQIHTTWARDFLPGSERATICVVVIADRVWIRAEERRGGGVNFAFLCSNWTRSLDLITGLFWCCLGAFRGFNSWTGIGVEDPIDDGSQLYF